MRIQVLYAFRDPNVKRQVVTYYRGW